MQPNTEEGYTNMSAKDFAELIRNKRNLLSVFKLKGQLIKDITYHPGNFSPWNF